MHTMAEIQGRPRFKGFFSVIVFFCCLLAFLVAVYPPRLLNSAALADGDFWESRFGSASLRRVAGRRSGSCCCWC
jgi:hypothetical protein